MTKYDDETCRKILEKHGWKPFRVEGHELPKDWVLMALQIATLEKME